MCCDVLGSNALCPYFYSSREDATRQRFEGAHVWLNPPFSMIAPFVVKLEAARAADPYTKAVLVLHEKAQKRIAQKKKSGR